MQALRNSAPFVLEIDGRRFTCPDGGTIGRQGTLVPEIFQGVPVLSRHHLRVDEVDGRWCLTLLPDARNETMLDQWVMSRGQRYALTGRHVITIDEFCFFLETGEDESNHTAAGSAAGSFDPFRILEQYGEPVLILDSDLRILWSSTSAARLLGGREFLDALSDDDRTRVRYALLTRSASLPDATPLRFRLRPASDASGICGRAGPQIGWRTEIEIEAKCHGEAGRLVLALHECGAELRWRAEVDETIRTLRGFLEKLALFSLSRAFQQGDVARSLSLLTVKAREALDCRRVRVWIRDPAGAEDDERFHCQGSHSEPAIVEPITADVRSDYCPEFFDRVRISPYLVSVSAESPAFGILREIGFVAPNMGTVLVTGIQTGDAFHGFVSFEHADAERGWSEAERHFALCIANFALLAIETSHRRDALAKLRAGREELLREIAEAERYVRRTLPAPLFGQGISCEWEFVPSEQLGGDSFGYHWLDERRLAVYIIDVVGHGLGAALFSVSVMNSIRLGLLPGCDFTDPASVLAALNRAFQMESQSMMTFTMWYGVFDRESQSLSYASAGHPAGILLLPPLPSGDSVYHELDTGGFLIGGLEESVYRAQSIDLHGSPAKLFLFTDGAFEISIGESRMWSMEEFVAAVRSTQFMQGGETSYLLARVRALCTDRRLPDDLCILRFSFNEED